METSRCSCSSTSLTVQENRIPHSQIVLDELFEVVLPFGLAFLEAPGTLDNDKVLVFDRSEVFRTRARLLLSYDSHC